MALSRPDTDAQQNLCIFDIFNPSAPELFIKILLYLDLKHLRLLCQASKVFNNLFLQERIMQNRGCFQFFFKGFDGAITTMFAHPDEAIGEIKAAYQKRQRVEGVPNGLRFIFSGKQLDDDAKTLQECAIGKENTLQVMGRLK